MPVSIDLRGKVEKATRMIGAGESYASVAKHFGVGKATVYRWHIDRLTRELEKRRREIAELEGRSKVLRSDFDSFEGKYRKKKQVLEEEYKKRKSVLDGEIGKLRKEAEAVKASFEARDLGWEEGVGLLKQVRDLGAERESLRGEIAKLKADVSNWEGEATQARSTLLQLKMQLSSLRDVVKEKERELNYFMNQIRAAESNLYKIKDEKRKLSETVKTFKEIIFVHELKKQKAWTQGEVKRLTGELEQLRLNIEQLRGNKEGLTEEVKRLKAESGKLRREKEERLKKAKELAEVIIEDAEQQKKRLLAGAEEEKRKILGEIEELRKQTEKLEATKKFVETAGRMKIEELKEARRTSEVEEAEQDAEPLRLYIPKLPPLKQKETEA